jgi:hypothetical protein
MTPLKMRTEKKMRRGWKPGHFTGSDDEAQGLGIEVSLRKQDRAASQFGAQLSDFPKWDSTIAIPRRSE